MVDDPSNRSGDKSGNAAPQRSASSLRGEGSIFRPGSPSIPPQSSPILKKGVPLSIPPSSAPRSSETILKRFHQAAATPELKHIDDGWDDEASVDEGWDEIGPSEFVVGDSGLNVSPQRNSQRVDTSPPEVAPQLRATFTFAAEASAVPALVATAELTPVPMVVCDGGVSEDTSESEAKSDESSVSVAVTEDVIWRGSSTVTVGGFSWRREVLPTDAESDAPDSAREPDVGSAEASHAEYYPPRPPPSSTAPEEAQPSFSVASDFDPKAPTQPKIARASRVPTTPFLFGLDRMLVWGLVLGGLFVAIIVVIVNQVALIHPRRTGAAPQGAGSVASSAVPRDVDSVSTEAQRLIPETATDRPTPRAAESNEPSRADHPDAGMPPQKKPKKPARARASAPPEPSFSPTRPILGTD